RHLTLPRTSPIFERIRARNSVSTSPSAPSVAECAVHPSYRPNIVLHLLWRHVPMSWANWKSLFALSRKSRPLAAMRRARLAFDVLEDRSVPSATPTVDLTTVGAVGGVNGAIFRQFSPQPTGTGYIDSFVRLQAKGAGTQAQQGFNTDARPVQFDENTSPQFTRSLLLANVPVVDIGGVSYREFL